MGHPARWIRLDSEGVAGIVAVCRGLARVQGPRGAPACLWGRAAGPVRLGEEVWAEAGDHVFALLVPRLLAPGRADRWLAWGLSPVVAALRRFGAHAYLDGNAIRLHGKRIGGGSAGAVEDCAVVFGVFPAAAPPETPGRGDLLLVDAWLSALNGEGRARRMLAAFRSAIEAQYGWAFDTDWPSKAERSAILSEAVQ